MNADTLALAVMDDDGFGCAITGMPADNAYERACARFGRADAAWPAARDLAERILREAGEEYEAADAELARYETKRGIPLPEYRRPFGTVLPDPEPAGKPALCPACFMAGTDWDAHQCQGTPEAPCFCFCQFPDDPDPEDDPAGYVVVLRGHYHGATGYEDRLCACPNPLTYAPQPHWYDPREGE